MFMYIYVLYIFNAEFYFYYPNTNYFVVIYSSTDEIRLRRNALPLISDLVNNNGVLVVYGMIKLR